VFEVVYEGLIGELWVYGVVVVGIGRFWERQHVRAKVAANSRRIGDLNHLNQTRRP
jgi:hypothetical protein